METVKPIIKFIWKYHEPRIAYTKLKKNRNGGLSDLILKLQQFTQVSWCNEDRQIVQNWRSGNKHINGNFIYCKGRLWEQGGENFNFLVCFSNKF